PIVITLDVMMPDLDGWSVLAALRQDPDLAEIPVIMITILDEHRRGVALGAAGYLTKPIDRDRLHTMVGPLPRAPRPARRPLGGGGGAVGGPAGGGRSGSARPPARMALWRAVGRAGDRERTRGADAPASG